MTELPKTPSTQLCSDFFGPLLSGDYLMAVMDDYSRFAEVEVLKSVSAETVILVLNKILTSRGTPDKIKTDNGPCFQSADLTDFAQ